MKRFMPASKKLLSFLLTFIIVFSLFSDVITVHGDLGITGARFVRTIDPATNTAQEVFYIFGTDFVEPTVRVGVSGNVPVTINESLSTINTIVIDDEDALREIKGKKNIINVTAEVGEGFGTVSRNVDLESIPTIDSISSSKVYVGKPLTITGSQFGQLGNPTDVFDDSLFVSGTPYTIGADCTINGDSGITIPAAKSPNNYGVSDIIIERRSGSNEIITVYSKSIIVVNELTGIRIERVDPNAGPRNKRNIISIYGQTGFSNFSDDMRIFVEGNEGVNRKVIKDGLGQIIGVSFELPERTMAGTVDLVLTSRNLGSEFVIPNAFVYLDIGNTLSIESDGINPNFKKETEQKVIQVKGRNIGYFSGVGYDKVSGVGQAADFIYGYDAYGDYTMFNNSHYYKVKYNGKYQSSTGPVDVTVIRQIRTMIDGDATVVDGVYGENDYNPVFELSMDTVYVKPADVNLDPNEPKSVDVAVETITTIFRETGGATPEVIYNRTEKYVVSGGFTYLPDEISPIITSITPVYGPSNKEIYMTIKGKDFQVFEDGRKPRVRIGNRECTVTGIYDDNNRLVDGRIITLGSKLKLRLPSGTDLAGAVDVVVINPSGGQKTLTNGFEFRNPAVGSKIPFIDSIKENYADLRGGDISGERVLITGGNFFTSADNIHRLVITIDGEKATIVGKVSSDGKTVTIIPPPGTVPGKTQLQIINDDGSMISAEFEYKLITSNPKITSIVPVKGGKGTKLIIKGEDFVLPDNTVEYDDPKRKGSVVLLGGIELNAYNYDEDGVITDVNPDDDGHTNNIYYNRSSYDHDGNPLTPVINLVGQMIKVQDITTIYVDIPDRFYSFNAASANNLESDPIPIGPLTVEVLNPDGAKSKEDITFNFMNPSTSPNIAGITPNSGSVAGGTVVTINGSGFKQDMLEVYFGSEKSEKVEFINSTLIRATVPDYPYTLPNGLDYLDVPVMVLNYDGGVDVVDNGFKYRVPASNPVINSISPNSGSSAGNDRVVIRGLDFRRTPGMEPEGLPKVYFNGEEAEVEWPAGNNTAITESLTVTTPSSLTSGQAEVILVNHDSGTCIFTGFTYIMSNPDIDSIMPEKVSRNGNVNVQINGSGFREGNLSELFSSSAEKVGRNAGPGTDAEDAIETIVAFGDEDTGDKKIVDTVLGPDYTIIGDLGFKCEVQEGPTESVLVSIFMAEDNSQETITRYRMEGGTKVADSDAEASIPVGSSHLFIINHNMDLNKPNVYDEGILVETTPSSVIITRRIAASAEVEYDGTQVTVKAPPTDRVGVRNLYVMNDDGGTADDEVTIMNPDSSPVITSIDPKNRARDRSTNQIVDYIPADIDDYSEVFTFVPLDGGAFLTISGTDFRRNVKVFLDDKPLEIVSKSINDDQLVIKVPPGTDADLGKDLRVVVVNEDGGTYDSSMLDKPHYIRYQTQESNPVIESIVPDKSSSRGSNRIAIYGNNFRAGVKVFIEGVECTATRDTVKPSELLSVLVPTGLEPGEKTVQVQNPDFGFVELANGLTIISTPEVTAIYDDEGDEINPLVLSVEGGEEIKLEGIQFMEGIRVIFGGTLKAKSELAEGETGLEGLNINNAEMVIVGGTAATQATLQPDGSILCTTPKLTMGKTSIIVINSDSGVSSEIAGEYQKPVPDTPGGIKVEVVDGDTLKLEWDKLPDVSYYEIYAAVSVDGKKSSGIYQYLGSIIPSEISETRLRYYLDGLMPSTWYSIKLRSVNLFGSSKYSVSTGYYKTLAEKVVTFYQDETANTGGVEQKDSIVMKGQELTYTLGEKSVGSSSGAVVNFEQPSYIIADPKIVKISYELIKRHPSSKIKINDKDMELNIKASNLAVEETTRVENSLRDDMDMRVSIDRTLGAEGDEIRIKLPRGYRIMVNPFNISLNMQVQNTTTRIKSFNGDIGLLLKYAESKKSLYPGGVYIGYYDKATGKIQIVTTQDLNGKAQSQISKTGEYVLIGKLVK